MPLAGCWSRENERPNLAGEELLRVYGAEPPVMADYTTELVGLSPSESGEARSVLEAMPSALMRVGQTLSLARRASDGTYSKHDEREE
jgi:hypothetical protein